MANYKIFCEGITDQVFIADCLEIFYGFTSTRIIQKVSSSKQEKLEIKFPNNIEVIEVGGCGKLSNEIYSSILEDNTENGGVNIVVFDADYTERGNGNKGFALCGEKLNNIRRNKKIDFEHYLWPNNIDDGIIEDLLRKLIPANKEGIYNCIESHQTCLAGLDIPNIKIAELKEKVGYYLYTVNKDSKPSSRDYKDGIYWDLNHNSIVDLANFKSFLDSFFK